MSAGFNQAIILGKLVEAPETIPTKSGALMLKAVLEVTTYRRGADGSGEEQATRVPATLFGKSAELFQTYVEPGHLVQLVGRLEGYERKSRSGDSWLTLNFVAEQLILLPNNRKASSDSPNKSTRTPATSAPIKEPRDWNRRPQMREVPLNDLGEPTDLTF